MFEFHNNYIRGIILLLENKCLKFVVKSFKISLSKIIYTYAIVEEGKR